MSLKRFVSREFFGRSSELEVLKGIAPAAIKGYATSLFLSGRRGTGKTELIRQLFNYLFTDQDEAIPFFYTINPAFFSVKDFSRDYLTKFIHHAIAFLRRDTSIINKVIYSLEDIRAFTKDAELRWAINIMDEYSEIIKKEEPFRIFLYALSAPYRCYLSTGKPVIIMIDDFNRLKDLYREGHDNVSDHWMLFEDSIKTPYTPHILTGFKEGLYDMLFNRTSIGEHLELMTLSGIDRNNSSRFFNSLCNVYNLDVKISPDLIDLFQGNPLYIKKFVNALRRSGGALYGDDIWRVYFDEITKGEIFVYWVSHLKGYIPEGLREDSLGLLYHLCSDGLHEQFSALEATSIVNRERVNDVLEALRSAGVIEEGFSTIRLIDDNILVDLIKALYQTEILKEPLDNVKQGLIEVRREDVKEVEEGFFEVTIPSTEKAETVAIKVLEEVARQHGVPSEIIGKLQIAVAELLNNVFVLNGCDIGRCNVRFRVADETFLIEVDVPKKELSIEGPDGEASFRLIKGVIDDIRIEKFPVVTRLIILKKFRKNPVHTSFL